MLFAERKGPTMLGIRFPVTETPDFLGVRCSRTRGANKQMGPRKLTSLPLSLLLLIGSIEKMSTYLAKNFHSSALDE